MEQDYKQPLKSPAISRSPMKSLSTQTANLFNHRIAVPIGVMLLQSIAAVYFVVDGVDDLIAQAHDGFTLDIVMECLIALALLGGVVLSSRYVARLTKELRWKEQSLASARGALAEHIAFRFQEWRLTPGEGEVALFALKGCDVSEIARLRGAATGTVRSQLSQIYAKANVSSQAMLVSLFIEDLLDIAPTRT